MQIRTGDDKLLTKNPRLLLDLRGDLSLG